MSVNEHINDQMGLDSDGPWAPLTRRIISCAMEVHSTLGPGLLERVYEDAMCVELRTARLHFDRQRSFPVQYKGEPLCEQRLDLVVEDTVVVELKSIQAVSDFQLAQLVSYLRVTRLPLGLLLNFNTLRLKDGIYRRLNTPTPPRRVPLSTPPL
jgi:GxxExxY protein